MEFLKQQFSSKCGAILNILPPRGCLDRYIVERSSRGNGCKETYAVSVFCEILDEFPCKASQVELEKYLIIGLIVSGYWQQGRYKNSDEDLRESYILKLINESYLPGDQSLHKMAKNFMDESLNYFSFPDNTSNFFRQSSEGQITEEFRRFDDFRFPFSLLVAGQRAALIAQYVEGNFPTIRSTPLVSWHSIPGLTQFEVMWNNGNLYKEYKLPTQTYTKLIRLWEKTASSRTNDPIQAIAQLLDTYVCFLQPDSRLHLSCDVSLRQAIAKMFPGKEFMELFASAFNVDEEASTYTSLFPDIEAKFGAEPYSAFDPRLNIRFPVVYVNPPFEEFLIRRLEKWCLEKLQNAETSKTSLAILLLLPVWKPSFLRKGPTLATPAPIATEIKEFLTAREFLAIPFFSDVKYRRFYIPCNCQIIIFQTTRSYEACPNTQTTLQKLCSTWRTKK